MTENGQITLFIGGHYEVTGSQITKYYFAGTQRIAMRKSTIPSGSSVEYLLSDHLGSTSINTDASGAKVSEMRYSPWGEIRSSWTASASISLADYTFTGQYSYMDDPSTSGVTEGFGLMFYNARMYDPALGRFTSADTIIPQNQGVQAWDRYAYTNNNPVRYNDPSGHCTGFANCFMKIISAGVFLADRAINNGELSNEDFRAAADFAAPAIASGSKESVSGFISEFVTGVASISLVTTADGQSQVFVEKGPGASLPGIGVSATHGHVFGLDFVGDDGKTHFNPLRYEGGATQGNASIPLLCDGACGPYFEGYLSDDRQVWGLDWGIELGATPTILGAAHTVAEKRDVITFFKPIDVHAFNRSGDDSLTGPELLVCRLMSMCGAQ